MKLVSNLFIPILVLTIIIYGANKKINVYDSFVNGAKEGLPMVISMFPPLLAMIFGINIFTSSGLVSYMFTFLKPLLLFINVPLEILPIAVMRPLSGSFGLALLNDVFESYGADTYLSILASVIQGSSDTTLYIITLYFGTIGIKKIKYALWAGLLADLATVILSIIIVPLFF
ncbi:MAG: spore maturation protein [Bacilli bacterium]|nr:spore maturation protein [Bacilli bacterium]